LTNSHEQPTRGGPPAWGLGEVLNTPHREHRPRTKGIHVPGPGMILWHDLELQGVGWEGVADTGLIWLRIGTGGGHL